MDKNKAKHPVLKKLGIALLIVAGIAGVLVLVTIALLITDFFRLKNAKPSQEYRNGLAAATARCGKQPYVYIHSTSTGFDTSTTEYSLAPYNDAYQDGDRDQFWSKINAFDFYCSIEEMMQAHPYTLYPPDYRQHEAKSINSSQGGVNSGN